MFPNTKTTTSYLTLRVRGRAAFAISGLLSLGPGRRRDEYLFAQCGHFPAAPNDTTLKSDNYPKKSSRIIERIAHSSLIRRDDVTVSPHSISRLTANTPPTPSDSYSHQPHTNTTDPGWFFVFSRVRKWTNAMSVREVLHSLRSLVARRSYER
ncbi:hypothetical protein LX32DRAFT_251719 [Colletotrichum zoysiae]|uniref:Uncharacterized protein n=1 Tax=Colletotrichum zoysiae TaxID=1216348 RepID=A0AAD9H2X6_9PEZI|nr:hypothetical protein LX32DRAFT_251719 [Colletotrichum zoysiae]